MRRSYVVKLCYVAVYCSYEVQPYGALHGRRGDLMQIPGEISRVAFKLRLHDVISTRQMHKALALCKNRLATGFCTGRLRL